MNNNQITAAKKKELELELEQLKTVVRADVAEELKEARSHGDLSENAEYDAAKLRQEQLEIKISELEEILRYAVIIDESAISTDIVSVGCVVTFYDPQLGRDMTCSIKSSLEADPQGKLGGIPSISDRSEVGSSLLGHKRGDEVNVHSRLGDRKLLIKNITVGGR